MGMIYIISALALTFKKVPAWYFVKKEIRF